jgi:RIP metalloprotease RseP
MSVLLTIGAFVVAFSVLVLIHEFGHFAAAKLVGVKVEEFGLGFPPRIWARKVGETIYSVNALIFGGFVRMLGMDSRAGKKDKRSFENKGLGARFKIMIGGVVMNVLAAWILLSIGFVVGIEPLLGPSDIFPAVESGVISLKEGAIVKSVDKGGFAEWIGILPGDHLVKFNSDEIDSVEDLAEILKSPEGIYEGERGGQYITFQVTRDRVWGFLKYKMVNGTHGDRVKYEKWQNGETTDLGIEFYGAFSFPRVKILDVKSGSNAYNFGLRSDDIIIAVNGTQIYSLAQYQNLISSLSEATFTISRGWVTQDVYVEFGQSGNAVVSSVIVDSPADLKGLEQGDLIISINGKFITTPEEVTRYVTEHKDDNLIFLIERGGKNLFVEIKPEDGRVGVYLSPLLSGWQSDLKVYSIDDFTSIIDIQKDQKPFYIAPFYAVSEVWRTLKMTGSLFADFVGSFASTGEISENVAGPVGIAQMAGQVAREGIMPFIRFIALLSISLAVINILPFPGLDGGKLIFLFIEFLTGRRVPAKYENYIHLFGYLLLLVLAVAVTYKDVLRLF